MVIILIVISLSCVSATDLENNSDNANFTQLNIEINETGEVLNLNKDYSYVEGDNNVTISKSINIDGNGHFINGNSSTIIFKINKDTNVFFENIKFIKNDIFRFEIVNNSSLNITFVNCQFNSKLYQPLQISNFETDEFYSYSGKISSNVKKLALKIIGNSKDIEAAKKIAKWIGKNIKHETNAGFYQTADMTLKRRLGNCASQTDLFLQMCVSVGLNKKHKLYYVHTGTMQFGKRHFFAAFDNIFVDVDARSKSPWGHASLNRKIFRITLYPLLPISKTY